MMDCAANRSAASRESHFEVDPARWNRDYIGIGKGIAVMAHAAQGAGRVTFATQILMSITMLLHGALGCEWHHFRCEKHASLPNRGVQVEVSRHFHACGCHGRHGLGVARRCDDCRTIPATSAADRLGSKVAPANCPCESHCGCKATCVFLGTASTSANLTGAVEKHFAVSVDMRIDEDDFHQAEYLTGLAALPGFRSAKSTCALLRVWRL